MIKMKKIDDNHVFDNDDVIYENNILKKPLFHGTRMWLANASDEEINKIREESFKIVKFLQSYDKNATKEEKDRINTFLDRLDFNTKYYCANSTSWRQVDTNKLFEYGSFYFTCSISIAVSYSVSICGEIGDFAYICSNVIKGLNIPCNKEIGDAIDFIFDLFDKHYDDERIVVALNDCNIYDLELENGRKNIEDIIDDLDLYVKRKSFRVKNIDNYNLYYISKKDFAKYILYLEDIDLTRDYLYDYYHLDLREECLKKAEEGNEKAQALYVEICYRNMKNEQLGDLYSDKYIKQGNKLVERFVDSYKKFKANL